jgi:hypothetical protein
MAGRVASGWNSGSDSSGDIVSGVDAGAGAGAEAGTPQALSKRIPITRISNNIRFILISFLLYRDVFSPPNLSSSHRISMRTRYLSHQKIKPATTKKPTNMP